jgi:hypothetical protein
MIENPLARRTQIGTFFGDVAIFVGTSLWFIPGTLAFGPIITIGGIIYTVFDSGVKLNFFSGSEVSPFYLDDSDAPDNSYESSVSNKFSIIAEENNSHGNTISSSSIINSLEVEIASTPSIIPTIAERLPDMISSSSIINTSEIAIAGIPDVVSTITELFPNKNNSSEIKTNSKNGIIIKTDHIPTGIEFLNSITVDDDFNNEFN